MKKCFLLMMTAMMTATVLAQGDERKEIELTSEERALVNSNNQFAFDLFRKARGGEDMLLSPLSITYALGMVNNGAAGQTQAEINQVLGFGEAGADAINAFCRKMLTEAPALDKNTRVDIANTIFVNEGRGYQLKPAFEQTANDYYDAQPQNRDFNDGQTLGVINQWASDHTDGMIPKLLLPNEFDPTAASYLLNALYFKGAWTLKFPKDSTREESFNGGDKVPIMHLSARLGYHETADYQAVGLPYGNESFRLTVLLPREDKTLDAVLAGMDGATWERLSFFLAGDSVDVKLPRIDTETSLDYADCLAEMGMSNAFVGEGFNNICVDANLVISKIKQVAKVILDEEGTEAAAVTVEAMSESAGPGHETNRPVVRLFHATRPFLYVISEWSTGTIFFIGQYLGISSSKTPDSNGIVTRRLSAPSATIYTLDGRQVTTPQRGHLYIRDGKKFVQP